MEAENSEGAKNCPQKQKCFWKKGQLIHLVLNNCFPSNTSVNAIEFIYPTKEDTKYSFQHKNGAVKKQSRCDRSVKFDSKQCEQRWLTILP